MLRQKDKRHLIVRIATHLIKKLYKGGIPSHVVPIAGRFPGTDCDSCCGQAVCHCPALALAAVHAELAVDWMSLPHQVLTAVEVDHPAVETETVRMLEALWGWQGLDGWG